MIFRDALPMAFKIYTIGVMIALTEAYRYYIIVHDV